jgi:hypothetical protein
MVDNNSGKESPKQASSSNSIILNPTVHGIFTSLIVLLSSLSKLILTSDPNYFLLITFVIILLLYSVFFFSFIDKQISRDSNLQNSSFTKLFLFTLWEKGNNIIVWACGGAFISNLITNNNLASILGALLGGLGAIWFQESITLEPKDDKLINKLIPSKKFFKQGERMIVFASGGAFLGGVLLPSIGSLLGTLVGIILSSVLSKETV